MQTKYIRMTRARMRILHVSFCAVHSHKSIFEWPLLKPNELVANNYAETGKTLEMANWRYLKWHLYLKSQKTRPKEGTFIYHWMPGKSQTKETTTSIIHVSYIFALLLLFFVWQTKKKPIRAVWLLLFVSVCVCVRLCTLHKQTKKENFNHIVLNGYRPYIGLACWFFFLLLLLLLLL